MCSLSAQANFRAALAWRDNKATGAALALRERHTAVWRRVQRALTHPDVEKRLKELFAIDQPIKARAAHTLGYSRGPAPRQLPPSAACAGLLLLRSAPAAAAVACLCSQRQR